MAPHKAPVKQFGAVLKYFQKEAGNMKQVFFFPVTVLTKATERRISLSLCAVIDGSTDNNFSACQNGRKPTVQLFISIAIRNRPNKTNTIKILTFGSDILIFNPCSKNMKCRMTQKFSKISHTHMFVLSTFKNEFYCFQTLVCKFTILLSYFNWKNIQTTNTRVVF